MTTKQTDFFEQVDPVKLTLLLLTIALLIGGGVGAYFVFEKIAALEQDIADAAEREASLQTQKKHLEEHIVKLTDDLQFSEDEREAIKEEFENEKDKISQALGEFEDLTDTVGDLKKLSETDEELLQKYSRVSFLNEHYVPSKLRDIDDDYLVAGVDDQQIHAEVRPFLEDLLEDAEDDDIELLVRSAYRSFGTQSILKSNYLVTYGSGANAFSADQGFSEHQLGTAVDFTSSAVNNQLVEVFSSTDSYEWLLENAYKYGFVLSYPEGNAFYVFEPWHWRFVGKKLARDLRRDDAYFYDWDQRDIDEYLLRIFD